MATFKKNLAEWSLRIGFAAMYLYSGIDIWRYPSAWTWAIPDWFSQLVSNVMPIEAYLKIQAAGEIVFAIALLAWFLNARMVRYIALLAATEMAGILFLGKTGIDSITFRDLGLLGGLLALYFILKSRDQSEKPVSQSIS